ncbi:hypothetical protein [Vibrio bathopelagicus]|uniref:hypothetical protein n=1 Tax=Vibrio bathopelagicus TaxID=2777577 RepID=UPI0018648490|nr:hypothetical protein [Vibrio bathopelagicus]
MKSKDYVKENIKLSCVNLGLLEISGVDGDAIIYGHVYSGLNDMVECLKGANLDSIKRVLPECDGSFVIFFKSKKDNLLHVITDKWASKNIFFGVEIGVFSDKIKDCLPSNPILNRNAANEFISLYGFLQGDKTLVDGVSKLRPATWYKYNVESKNVF